MAPRVCIETIAVQNRQFKNLEYHEARLNKTRRALWGSVDTWNLSEMIIIPDSISEGLYKCRISYSETINDVRWEGYAPRVIRKIRKVYHDTVEYPYKYDQRPELDTLFAQRGDADEILIIKKGMVTDAYYCNVAFLKEGKWHTPDTHLLPGTLRALLLDSGTIEKISIAEEEIAGFSHIRLFNAMVGWEGAWELEIKWVH